MLRREHTSRRDKHRSVCSSRRRRHDEMTIKPIFEHFGQLRWSGCSPAHHPAAARRRRPTGIRDSGRRVGWCARWSFCQWLIRTPTPSVDRQRRRFHRRRRTPTGIGGRRRRIGVSSASYQSVCSQLCQITLIVTH